MNYAWHIRGGLKGINIDGSGNPTPDHTQGDLFSYKLDYELAGQWSGNIGKQSWNHVDGANTIGVRDYQFTYDNADRLKTATYSSLDVPSEDYGIPNINYDKNGNILNLQRKGKTSASTFGNIDNLTYFYSGNKLTSVNDAISGNHEVDFVPRGGGAYTYYPNGALKSDENEQITNTSYNTFLDQPEQVTLSDGRWLKHTYDGSGALIKTEYSNGEYWEFVNKFVYKNGELYQMSIPDGRAIYQGGNWILEFDYKDHLGNTRVSFSADGDRLVKTAITDFDPWGVELHGIGMESTPENLFKFQGKEKIKELGWYNFGARMYNPEIGRFISVDGLASDMPAWSPYNAFLNNPLRYIDPDGNAPLDVIILFNKSNGRLSVMDKDHYQKGLPTRVVSANEYVHGGIRDSEGRLTHNQILQMDNFFSGGKSTDGIVERDPNRPMQKAIPNGKYDLLDNDADTKHTGWFRLDSKDNRRYNDKDDATGRDGFRLHMGTESWGCVTCDVSQGDRKKEWGVLTEILNTTSTTTVPERRGNQSLNPFSQLTNYGTIKVIGEDKIPTKND